MKAKATARVGYAYDGLHITYWSMHNRYATEQGQRVCWCHGRAVCHVRPSSWLTHTRPVIEHVKMMTGRDGGGAVRVSRVRRRSRRVCRTGS
jgi:hypothetical protein